MKESLICLGVLALLVGAMTVVITRSPAWLVALWERITGIARLRAELHSADGNIGVLYRENAKLKVLLNTACLRTAPTTMQELMCGSNQSTGNVCYINPKALGKIGNCEVVPGISTVGSSPWCALIVATELMPEFGVIYAPIHPAFFTEDFFRAAAQSDVSGQIVVRHGTWRLA